jgi:hypothetical protein
MSLINLKTSTGLGYVNSSKTMDRMGVAQQDQPAVFNDPSGKEIRHGTHASSETMCYLWTPIPVRD